MTYESLNYNQLSAMRDSIEVSVPTSEYNATIEAMKAINEEYWSSTSITFSQVEEARRSGAISDRCYSEVFDLFKTFSSIIDL